MATSRRDPQQNARVNRGIQNMSPGLKPSESDQGLRRARSVPTSPDRRLSPSPASISSNTCRPASSFNARTTSSRSTSSSASSSHGKTLHSASSMAGARQTNTMRRKAEKPGATSVWPPALAAPNTSSKDMTRAAKSPSTMQKSNNLSTRPGIEKAAASSVKPKSQKTTAGPLGAGKTQAASSTRAPGAITKKRMGAEKYVSIQRTTSVPARQKETPKIEEQDAELLMEFDETESISTSSIEEHLHERLPDPVDLKSVDLNSKTSSSLEEYKNQENTGDILEEKHDGKDNEDLSTGDRAYIGNSDINIPKEAVDESESEEAVDETGLKQDVCATELNETVDQTKLNEAASETESKEANDEAKLKQVDCETALKEAANGTELRDAVIEHELIAQEKAKTKEKIMQPTKTVELAQKWRKDEGRSNEATEEGRSKPIQERKNKVMALVGRFETAMSG
ncbi:unnamed protein product [Miscanthus lutarioriparius]|uniref:Calmodulin-binding domain-containing protein n=1 Tax=Miscanthus lutarioriparius TaxID=422564 RepID=A0A811PGF3_9POAL|nr:unnamed protein product [Miscanthus lutarioriparius]